MHARRTTELAAALESRITVVDWVDVSTERAHLVLRISDDEADGDTDRLVSRVAGGLTLHAHCSVKMHDSEHVARVPVSGNDPLYYQVTFAGAITRRPGQHERYRYDTVRAALAAARSGCRPSNTRVHIDVITYEYPGGGTHGYTLDRDGHRAN